MIRSTHRDRPATIASNPPAGRRVPAPAARIASLLETIDGVRRSWWTVVAGICLGLATTLAVLHHVPATYEASARVHLPPGVAADVVEPEALVETFIDRSLLVGAGSRVEPPSDGDRLENLVESVRSRADVGLDGRWLTVSVHDGDPVRAADVANRLARLYVVEGEMTGAAGAGGEAEAAATPSGTDGQRRRQRPIDRSIAFEAAAPPKLPTRPRPLFVAALLTGVGLALFVGPIAVRTMGAPIVRSATGLSRVTTLPLLGIIPTIPTPEKERLDRKRRVRNLRWSAVSVAVLAFALLRYW